jgi:hypothetical protein
VSEFLPHHRIHPPWGKKDFLAEKNFGVCHMSIVPPNLAEKIQFYEAHLAQWAANAVAIGTTAPKVTALQTKTTAARAALTQQEEAKIAAKGATSDLRAAVSLMADSGSDIIKEINAKAATDGDNVYTLAGIPSPATPSPVPAPGTPTDFSVTLVPADGSLRLGWKCPRPANAVGIMYQVERRIGDAGAFQLLGSMGVRKFIDSTVPAGTAQVTYRITATRTTGAGIPATFLVQFGVGGAGEMTASVMPPTTPRLAA